MTNSETCSRSAEAGNCIPGKFLGRRQSRTPCNCSNVQGTFTYDMRGRELSGGGRTLSWSQFDLPEQIRTDTGVITQYRYNGNGNRVQKKLSSPDASTIYFGGLYEQRNDFSGESEFLTVQGDGFRKGTRFAFASSTGNCAGDRQLDT